MMDGFEANWRKSRRSSGGGNACVEVAAVRRRRQSVGGDEDLARPSGGLPARQSDAPRGRPVREERDS
jgi:hypothetical protein